MIFPFLRGLVAPGLAPITYLLIALNVMVFCNTYEAFVAADGQMDEILADDSFLESQGVVFAEMIHREPQLFSTTIRTMGERVRVVDHSAARLLGSLAFRNSEFVARAGDYKFGGDEIAVGKWRETFSKFENLKNDHPSFQWGLSQTHSGLLNWFTYQFSHSGWMHIFWNMVFLAFFGCFIETTLGGSFVAIGYIGGGLAGALGFAILSGVSSSPLVGASASVSGLMGLVAFSFLAPPKDKPSAKLRFFFWLSPFQGYFGFVNLPTWTVLLVSLLPDLAGYFSSSADFGSVAYAAHLGGASFGALMAYALRRGWLVREITDAPENTGDDLEQDPPDDIRRAG